jgi:hypothetical protein
LGLGIWDWEFGIGNLGLGIRDLEFGIGNLGLEIWDLEFGIGLFGLIAAQWEAIVIFKAASYAEKNFFNRDWVFCRVVYLCSPVL